MCGLALIHFPQEAPFARRVGHRFGGISCSAIQLCFISFVILGRQPVKVKSDPDAEPPPTGTRTPPVKKARGKIAKASAAPAPDAGVQNGHQQEAAAPLPPAPAPFQFTAGFLPFIETIGI